MSNEPVAFISYCIMEKGLCLSEVQIKKQFQGKHDILRKMLKQVIISTKNYKCDNVCCTIRNNQHSVDVFTHIGMKNTKDCWYEISIADLLKWIDKKHLMVIPNEIFL